MAVPAAKFVAIVLSACAAALPACAFVPAPRGPLHANVPSPSTRLMNDASGGGIEEIEFRIYPDGRVTEVVRGVKGQTCTDVTKAINEQLGNVVDVSPTEEMFEEEVLVEQTLEQKDGGWEGASTW